jgi:hypothetical protein
MRIPKYVEEMLNRSTYDFTTEHQQYAIGYTIRIAKPTIYAKAETFANQVHRLVNWVNRQCPAIQTAYVIHVPTETHYREQYAIVTIFEPIMRKLEHLIKE